MNKDRLSGTLLALAELVSRLRGDDGCPWDIKQTDSTIKMYLLEEAYEVLDAIEGGSPEDVCQELGDLLFMILFLSRMAEERGDFDLVEVMEKITEKMINRHPHVFGLTDVKSPEEVAINWEKIKRKEKGPTKTLSSSLQGIPADLPALLRTHRLSERASKLNFDWQDMDEIWNKVEEKFDELRKTILQQNRGRIGEKIGDLLFVLVNLARDWELNAEHLLRNTNQKFLELFKEMEAELNASSIDPDKATPAEMKRAWERVKARVG